MQLLVENLSHQECGMITESAVDGKSLYISGIFMGAEARNRNGRIYPLSEMQRAVKQLVENATDQNGIAWGELDHPPSLTINSDRISHVITDLRVEGNNVYGKAKILPTPMGNIAKVLITEGGLKMGVSSRGSGDVNESGIVSNYNLITCDIVSQPSCQSAYPTSIYESLERAKNGQQIITLAESVQHDIAAQKYLVSEIKKWVSRSLGK
jgi:hypothetical protein